MSPTKAKQVSEQTTQQTFDIVISGAGMAGSTLAFALVKALPNLKVALIEEQSAPISKASFDSRSIALAAASVNELEKLGLWQALKGHACAIEHIHVSDKGHFGKTKLTAKEYQQDALGYVLEVEYLGQLLDEKLNKLSQVTRFSASTISHITSDINTQHLTLNNGEKLSCALLVIAEGGQSPTRDLAGFSVSTTPYEQHAVIANIALESAHNFSAYERFTEQGPIALLPLNNKRYSLVYTAVPEEAKRLMALSDTDFIQQVQDRFGYRAGVFKSAGARVSYPLSLRLSTEIVKHRTALLGNSLHNLHPIAGQGFNLAMRDISQLVKEVVKASHDIGSYAMLRAYKVARQKDIQTVSLATDALVRIFSNNSKFMALTRNVGLFSLMICDDLKRPVAMQAMGYRS